MTQDLPDFVEEELNKTWGFEKHMAWRIVGCDKHLPKAHFENLCSPRMQGEVRWFIPIFCNLLSTGIDLNLNKWNYRS